MAVTKEQRLATAYSDLSKVNAAIDTLLNNSWVERLEIGSQEFRRVYDKGRKPSLTELKQLRRELLDLIDGLEDSSEIVYRAGATVPLIVRRGF